MEALGQVVIAAAALLEAEGRTFRLQLLRLATAIALVVVAVLIGLIGTGFAIFGVFSILSEHVSGPAAAMGMGVVAMLVSGGIAWVAYQMMR